MYNAVLIAFKLLYLFEYNLSYAQFLCLNWCVVSILYGSPSVLTLIVVPQKCQYWKKWGRVQKWTSKYGMRH